MARTEINLKGIAGLDQGRIGVAVQDKIDQAVRDCRDRPGVPGARTVNLQIVFKPKADDGGKLDTVSFEHKIGYQEPKRESRKYSAKVLFDGTLVLNELTPDDVNQMTIDEIEDAFSTDDTDSSAN